jgi:hypothetical protein
MANNCYNFIEISGSEEEIKEFAKLLEINDTQQDGCEVYVNLINKFCGEVKQIGDGNATWFDLEHEQTEGDNTSLRVSGDSAWSPCLCLFTAISKKYPSFVIRYEYEEQGSDFSGWADIQNGNMEDNCFAYWEGLVAMNSESALQNALENELSCYDTEEELIESEMYKAFDQEQQNEILKAYSDTEINTNN